ncbi:competence type IV pilus minor pilin ComGF [Fundicoccus culcitae]|uniref:Competence type IV pilus minor pilin ComGF n=1 Tax=Fundicoccus culcitae TaxID=2969821 RepID=A0ABY5P678_9LACT|nr:competence type IV pilus minor pilin ComGF [Fundicoccus culcitae]UUX34227.1 competence type IV pilus minor pilin ComGF [Fundicoccus culcitae]
MTHKRAFSLMEMLLSLFIFSLIISGLYTSFGNYANLNHTIRNDQSTEWHLFLITLEKELEQFIVEDVQYNKIFMLDSTNMQAYQIILQNNKIYKTPGHQPYLYQVNDWNLSLDENLLLIRLQFKNNQIFEAHLVVRLNSP